MSKLLTQTIFLILLALAHSCQIQDCNKLNLSFENYDAAINAVKSSNFKVYEKCDTRSSWVRGAKYYSCDGKTGYLLIINVSYILYRKVIDTNNQKTASKYTYEFFA